RIDHLIWAAPDLALGVEQMEDLLGAKMSAGGVHPDWGTRNCLVSLGPTVYLEVIGPDPERTGPPPTLWGIGGMKAPRLVSWAATGVDLGALTRRAAAVGVPLGDVRAGGRVTPEGHRLTWTLTEPETLLAGGVAPFFIDWGDTPHPATTAAAGGTLLELRGFHPDARRVRRTFGVLGITDVSVDTGDAPALVARVETRGGVVEVR
ncbi:MAG: VOC family protein, partial [Gemmatimonadota bacterium]